MSTERVILLHTSAYDFIPQQGNGERLKGLKLQYITDYIEKSENAQGTPIMMATAPIEAREGLRAVPGVYEVDFRMRPGKDNKPTLTPVSVEFISAWTPGAGVVEVAAVEVENGGALVGGPGIGRIRTRTADIALASATPESVAANGAEG